MKSLKRMLCMLLCVVILSTTVGAKYFDANHMEKVEAASIVIAGGITLATIAEICLFVGTTALAAYGIYEGYENREEIARFGKEFIDSCGDTVDGWVAQIVDASGQDYVFGSEALELVQDTYLVNGEGVESALNYGKNYRIADWLQQDWAGQLIDPLVNIGLTLSQLIDVMRALGLKSLQGLNAQQLLELLKNVLPQIDPALLPGASPAPAVDPAVDPIYYPDPDAHPDRPPRPVIDPVPGKKPNPDPKPDPDPDPKPDPDPDPDPKPDPDPDPDPAPLPDMDTADYKVELKGIFPFCIPFDFIALLKTLDAEPRAPCFDLPVVIPALNYREDVKLDLSIFDDVAKVIRLCEKVSFLLFLMFVTSKVIRW